MKAEFLWSTSQKLFKNPKDHMEAQKTLDNQKNSEQEKAVLEVLPYQISGYIIELQ